MATQHRRTATLALAGILIAIGGCAESPSSGGDQFVHRGAHPRFDAGGTASAVIGAQGGTLRTAAGDQITFPAGALSAPTTVSIASDDDYVGVQLQPHGLRFPAGHEPVLELNAAGSNAGAFHSLGVAYVDESGGVAEVLSAASSGGDVSTNLHHFSGYTAIGH